MMGKQREGYRNFKVLAGGVDAWKGIGHRASEDMWN
jgi:hypothetical protein